MTDGHGHRGTDSFSGPAISRRRFMQAGAGAGAGLLLWRYVGGRAWAAPSPATGLLDPTSIPKFARPLVMPPAMPRSGTAPGQERIGARLLPDRGSPVRPGDPSGRDGARALPRFGATAPSITRRLSTIPAFTIEATWGRPVRVKWINELLTADGRFRPHLLPVDQTLHWANPSGGARGRDSHGHDQTPYRGPVPIVTHLHGGHSDQQSDGYPEAWYLPKARNIPGGFAKVGSKYQEFRALAQAALGQAWTPGSAVFQYDNNQRASTMWYHDHTLGMTRLNVYAGPAGFYLLRGGPDDAVGGTLPGPAPALGDPPGRDYFEVPLAIQDRSVHRGPASSSTRTVAPSSRGSRPPSSRSPSRTIWPAVARATSHRSGTRSSSATRCSSTAAPGHRSRSSSGATASVFLTAAIRAF